MQTLNAKHTLFSLFTTSGSWIQVKTIVAFFFGILIVNPSLAFSFSSAQHFSMFNRVEIMNEPPHKEPQILFSLTPDPSVRGAPRAIKISQSRIAIITLAPTHTMRSSLNALLIRRTR